MSFNIPVVHKIKKITEETPRIKSYVFFSPKIAEEAEPGQFLMVWVPSVDEIPISIASVNKPYIELAILKSGDCTSAIHEKKVGDYLGLRGPYGHGFSLNGKSLLMVGGGCGCAPLRFAAEKAIKLGKKVTILMGARTKDELLYLEKFEELGNVFTATNDGSHGHKGYVTDILLNVIKENHIDHVLSCGPELMMSSVYKIVRKYKIPVEVCLERYMKCGMGICGSCDIGGFLVCRDGPVFNAEKIYEKIEFGLWKRDQTGMRIPLKDNTDIVSFPSKPFVPSNDPLLSIQVCKIKFSNPFMNAAGAGFSGKLLYRYAVNGAGAVVTKSIGLTPRDGYPGPNFFEISPDTYVNSMGLPNPGVENYKLEIEDAKLAKVPIIASIFGGNAMEFGEVAYHMKNYGVDAIEVNVSCPHTKLGSIEEHPDEVMEIVKIVKKMVDELPVFVKISPNADYVEVAKAAVDGGADGITAINTFKVRPKDPVLDVYILGNPTGFGGRSGKKHAELGKKIVFELYEEVDVPIIGVGGIFSGKDVVDYARNGAGLYQICSALVKQIDVFDRIKKETRKLVIKNNVKNISELVGTAHKK